MDLLKVKMISVWYVKEIASCLYIIQLYNIFLFRPPPFFFSPLPPPLFCGWRSNLCLYYTCSSSRYDCEFHVNFSLKIYGSHNRGSVNLELCCLSLTPRRVCWGLESAMCNSPHPCGVTRYPRLLTKKQSFCDDLRQSKIKHTLLSMFWVNCKTVVDLVKMRFIYSFGKLEHFPNLKVSFHFNH